MGTRTFRLTLVATALAGLAGACSSTSAPAWSGTKASASLRWTIHGAAATSGLCDAVGGAFVTLSVSAADPGCDPGTADCGETRDAWVWDCAAGTAGTDLVFHEGTVWLSWALVSADGVVRQPTSWQAETFHAGDNGYVFNFTCGWLGPADAAVVSHWTINGAAPDADSCTTAGAATVRLVSRIAGYTTETPWDSPCTDGSADTGNQFRATQRYDLRWELRDAADTVLAQYPADGGWQNEQMTEGDNTFTADFTVSTGADADADADADVVADAEPDADGAADAEPDADVPADSAPVADALADAGPDAGPAD